MGNGVQTDSARPPEAGLMGDDCVHSWCTEGAEERGRA